MKIRITAVSGQGDFGPIAGLPDGGTVLDGATRTFTLQDTRDWDRVRPNLLAAKTAGTITYQVLADTLGDEGAQIFKRTLTVGHADLTAAAVSQTITDPIGAFPTGARLMGYRKSVSTAFSGGGSSSCAIDVGFNGATDVLDDGQTVFTGVAAETFGAGTNALPLVRRDIGGKTLQAAFTADVNVALLTAGAVTFEVFYGVWST